MVEYLIKITLQYYILLKIKREERYWGPGNSIWEEFEELRKITF